MSRIEPYNYNDEPSGRSEMSKELTEQEVCIGSLGQQKVYLKWSDVKDICTYAVSDAYEETKRENEKLKKQLEIAVCTLETYYADTQNWRDIFEEDGDDSEYHAEALYFDDEGYKAAQSALNEIKELEK